jgi:hypothetical protein
MHAPFPSVAASLFPVESLSFARLNAQRLRRRI